MKLALEKIVTIIIFLIVLIVLILFTDIPKVIGGEIFLQQELRKCCQAYIARGCPDPIPNDIICNSKDLETLVLELGFIKSGNADADLTKDFCNCP